MVVNNPHIQVGDRVKPRYRLIQFKQKFLEILTPIIGRTKTHSELEQIYRELCDKDVECTQIFDKAYQTGIKYNGTFGTLFSDLNIIPKQLLKKC